MCSMGIGKAQQQLMRQTNSKFTNTCVIRDKGLLRDNEFLLAVNIFIGENHHNEVGSVNVAAFIYEGQDSLSELKPILDKTTGPIPVCSVHLTLTLKEFVGMFKRFDVMLTWDGLNLAGRNYNITEEVEPTV